MSDLEKASYTKKKMNDLVNVIKNLWDIASPIVLPILLALIVWIVGSKVIKCFQKFLAKAFARTNMDISVSKFLQSLLVFIAKAVLIIAIIDILGIPTTGIITIIGSLGLTIGLALQGSLSNFAGGVLILLFKPFKVNDYIVEDSHKNEGTVLAIDLLYTKLLTVDNKTVIIPNGTLANSSLTNVTQQAIRRLDIEIGISYKADLLKAKKVLEQVIAGNDKIMHNKDVSVFVKSLDDDCVTLETRVWVLGADYWDTKWKLLEDYKLTFDKEGIEIPFRQVDVHVDGNS